jgi:DNA-binding protein YbaB
MDEDDVVPEELMAGFARQTERLQEMRRDLEKISVTASRPDGLVTVVVGPYGQLQDLRFDPRVYRRLDSGELARAIMELVSEATADVTEQLRKIMTPLVPEGLSPGEETDFAALLPQSRGASGAEESS